MQLFGFRKTPDLSLAPLQASCLRDLRAQIWRPAVVGSSRPFAHSGKSAVHKRPSLNNKRLIVERRSLHSGLRPSVETTELVICDSPAYDGGGKTLERLPVSPSTQGVCGGRVFQSGGDAEEGRAPPLMLLFAEHEARQ